MLILRPFPLKATFVPNPRILPTVWSTREKNEELETHPANIECSACPPPVFHEYECPDGGTDYLSYKKLRAYKCRSESRVKGVEVVDVLTARMNTAFMRDRA